MSDRASGGGRRIVVCTLLRMSLVVRNVFATARACAGSMATGQAWPLCVKEVCMECTTGWPAAARASNRSLTASKEAVVLPQSSFLRYPKPSAASYATSAASCPTMPSSAPFGPQHIVPEV